LEKVVTEWNSGQGALDESEALRSAMHQNPYTKLFVAMGLLRPGMPMGTVEQVLNQLELDPRLEKNIFGDATRPVT